MSSFESIEIVYIWFSSDQVNPLIFIVFIVLLWFSISLIMHMHTLFVENETNIEVSLGLLQDVKTPQA
jgi:hypothetical protein